MAFRPKTDKQADFVKQTKARLSEGVSVKDAAKEAAAEVYGDKDQAYRLLKNPTILEGLSIDDPTVADWFKQKITKRLADVEERGEFPAWLGDDPKLKLDYYKSIKADAATVNLVKTERRINEDSLDGRSDHELDFKQKFKRWPTEEELAHRLQHKRWPQEMTLDGDSDKTAIN